MADSHRELCRKQHRVLGHFLAVVSWTNGLDCIAVDRVFLEKLFGIWQLREVRVDWFKEDIAAWFPHSELYYYRQGKIASVFASRLPISEYLPAGKMSDE